MKKITLNGKDYFEQTEAWEIRTSTEFDVCMGHRTLFNGCFNPLPVREKKLIHTISAGINLQKNRADLLNYNSDLFNSNIIVNDLFIFCPPCKYLQFALTVGWIT